MWCHDADPSLPRKLARQFSETNDAFQAGNEAAFAQQVSAGVQEFGNQFAEAVICLLVQLNLNADIDATIDCVQTALSKSHTASLPLRKRIELLRKTGKNRDNNLPRFLRSLQSVMIDRLI